MANIKFDRKEVEKHIKLDDKTIERINMFGVPASVSATELEIEVFPNRPDLISLPGFIRAIKSFLGKETGLKKYRVNAPEKDYKVKIESSVKEVRPYTACAIVKNLNFDDVSIKDIINVQEKLHSTLGRNRKKIAIGIYPFDKIKLPIKYEARKPDDIKFIPLDMDRELTGREILIKNSTGREYASLLESASKYPVFSDSSGKILSMPPIINSHETGKITSDTKEVFVECSGFDFSALKKTLNIIVTALADLGGKIYGVELDYGKKEITPDLSPAKMKIDLENVNTTLGLDLKEKDLEKLLSRMGYDYKSGRVSVPAWRTDILHEVDLIEDVAIAYGYENLEPEIPKVATIGEESKESKLRGKVTELLNGLGLMEISSFHFIKQDEAKRIKFEKHLEVENSKTDYKILRPNLLISALRILGENTDNEYPQNIFEIGRVFSLDHKAESGIGEREHLFVALTPGNFTELKRILDYLMKMLGLEYQFHESEIKELIHGRTGKIAFDGKEIGHIGEVHPDVLGEWHIKLPVSVLEIDLEEIFARI